MVINKYLKFQIMDGNSNMKYVYRGNSTLVTADEILDLTFTFKINNMLGAEQQQLLCHPY